MNGPDDDLRALAAVAVEAGELIRTFEASGIPSRAKSDRSPVTDADEAAETLILARLRALHPHVPIVSEEAAAAGIVPATGDEFFLVDPLDGTREFLKGNGEYTVNIALVRAGAPVMGVVHAPAKKRLFAGERGRGAFEASPGAGRLEFRPIAARLAPEGGLIAAKSRSHGEKMTDEYLAHYPIAGFVIAGSSLKFGLIAAGEADLYPRHGPTMAWDTAAGQAVLEAAGGSVTDLHGKPLAYAGPSFVNPFFVARGRTIP